MINAASRAGAAQDETQRRRCRDRRKSAARGFFGTTRRLAGGHFFAAKAKLVPPIAKKISNIMQGTGLSIWATIAFALARESHIPRRDGAPLRLRNFSRQPSTGNFACRPELNLPTAFNLSSKKRGPVSDTLPAAAACRPTVAAPDLDWARRREGGGAAPTVVGARPTATSENGSSHGFRQRNTFSPRMSPYRATSGSTAVNSSTTNPAFRTRSRKSPPKKRT